MGRPGRASAPGRFGNREAEKTRRREETRYAGRGGAEGRGRRAEGERSSMRQFNEVLKEQLMKETGRERFHRRLRRGRKRRRRRRVRLEVRREWEAVGDLNDGLQHFLNTTREDTQMGRPFLKGRLAGLPKLVRSQCLRLRVLYHKANRDETAMTGAAWARTAFPS